MKIPLRISQRAAAFAVSSFVLAASPLYAQQSLSLSYKLDVRTDTAPPVPAVNRCAGFQWASLAGCGRDLLAKIGPLAERAVKAVSFSRDGAITADATGSTSAAPAESVAMRADELPTLGGGAPEQRYVRAAGGREALIGSSRTADLLLKFGSKHRLRSSEEGGWDWYRFNDTTYQTHLQNNGHKALGVELLVPFQ